MIAGALILTEHPSRYDSPPNETRGSCTLLHASYEAVWLHGGEINLRPTENSRVVYASWGYYTGARPAL